MKWSILIAALPYRSSDSLMCNLKYQIADHPIEVITLHDTQQTIGEKRNRLMEMARGEYISFVDDDDEVDSLYVSSVLNALRYHPDVVCFGQLVRCGKRREYCTYSASHEMEFTRINKRLFLWRGKPAHTMVWRRELVGDILFPETNFGEDVDWSARAAERVKDEYQIDDVLYYYNKAER